MVLIKSSSESEVMNPMNEEPKQIAAYIWRDLEIKISRFTLDSPFIPSFIGGLLGFWLATLIFSLNDPNIKPVYLAFCFLWAGSLITYLIIYKKQRELIGNSKEEILQAMRDVDKTNSERNYPN
jgi:hypothetical protein